ncbi:class F sortase [Streptomyces montanisoli]|uniref:Class F sortase n=1 Tax=Streptomyces montanisoli TaxID=2798581 RepID=A0A940MD89_9ACTN|nr:class F sortase [Streptomyces montanisoli]MBP0456558.1 class F sortase [Streptomyces montanisoli]
MTPSEPNTTSRTRRMILVIALVVVCVAGGLAAVAAGWGGGGSPPPQPRPAAAGQLPGHTAGAAVPAPSSSSPAGDGTTKAAPSPSPTSQAPAARPTAIDIPAIGVHSKLLDLGLNGDGTVEVPKKPLQAGWFHDSPRPGQDGPAVILGHVDSYQTGPAVFYRLGSVRPHDKISVTRADHSTVHFTVDAVRKYEKKDFPTLEVYGNTPDPEIRLITCSDWNAAKHEYDGNTVVYGHLTK